ncbi:hypothetical protein INR49_014992 [Caranx melampygus]|nr:hypothetical protein INR49_014992 [Caranx melampygus]
MSGAQRLRYPTEKCLQKVENTGVIAERADHGVTHVAVSLCSFQPVQNDLLCNVVMFCHAA